MPRLLQPIPYSADLLEAVQGLDCGNTDFGSHATQWIRGDESSSASALQSMRKHRTQVWLYYDAADLVGFGSLGPSHWTIGADRVRILFIPHLGIDYRFQRQPIDDPPKYCDQIMGDLIGRAQQIKAGYAGVGLFVKAANANAIHLYQKYGFEIISETGSDPIKMLAYF